MSYESEKSAVYYSIIVATYNSALTLKQCLDSVVSQTFLEFEVLIVDGGSTDETLALAQQYNDPRIKIVSEPDEGIYDAMNKGIRLARGEWVYFIGSDDTLYNDNVLKDIFDIIAANKTNFVYGNVKVVGDTAWAKDGTIYDKSFSLQKILSKNICHQAIFYRRKIFKKIGSYNVKYQVCADWDLNLRSWARYKFIYTDTIIAKFNGGNTSTNVKDYQFGNDIWVNVAKYFKWKLFYKEFKPYLPVLFRRNKNPRENILSTIIVYLLKIKQRLERKKFL